MKLLKIFAAVAVLATTACGSRDWRANSPKGVVQPESKIELSPVAAASLKVSPEQQGQGKATILVAMSNCEQFSTEISIITSNSRAGLKNTTRGIEGKAEARCVGADGGCERVVVAFSQTSGGEKSQTDMVFALNEHGIYRVVGMPEADEFLSNKNSKCEALPKDETIAYEQD